MPEQAAQLKSLIDSADRILLTSHISPDPDALSSLVLMGTTLRQNLPGKHVQMVLEERPDGLDFIEGYSEVTYKPVYEVIGSTNPELFILLDGNNYERCSRHDGEKIRQFIREKSV